MSTPRTIAIQKEMFLPYKEEPWENSLYQSYVAKAYDLFKQGAVKNIVKINNTIDAANKLKRELIDKYNAYQSELTEKTDDAIIGTIGAGFIPDDLQNNFIERLNLGTAVEAAKAALPFSPVVLVVVAGIIFLIYKK